MYDIKKVLSEIELFAGEKMLKKPIVSGYRPLFDLPNMKTSGRIDLVHQPQLYPGEKGLAIISFIAEMPGVNLLQPGMTLSFGEGLRALGTATILSQIQRDLNENKL